MKTCLDCHFLAKENVVPLDGRSVTLSLRMNERAEARKNPKTAVPFQYTLKCSMGVWDEGISGTSEERASVLWAKRTSEGCFFHPYHPAMLNEAARELQKRQQEYAALKKAHRYTQIGLGIAIVAILANLIIAWLF